MHWLELMRLHFQEVTGAAAITERLSTYLKLRSTMPHMPCSCTWKGQLAPYACTHKEALCNSV